MRLSAQGDISIRSYCGIKVVISGGASGILYKFLDTNHHLTNQMSSWRFAPECGSFDCLNVLRSARYTAVGIIYRYHSVKPGEIKKNYA